MSTGFLDIQRASRFLSLSPRTIRKHLASIPHFTSPDGGKFLFRQDELLAWMEKFRAPVEPMDLRELLDRVVRPAEAKRRRRPPSSSPAERHGA